MAGKNARIATLVQQSRAALDGAARLIARWPRLITYLAAGVTTVLGAGLTFRRATTPWSVLPDNDYWGNIRGLITERGLAISLDELFRHNNEHIIAIPKIVYAANYLLTSGSNIGLIIYSLVVGAACAILLLALARDVLRDTPARWALCGVLFPLAMFSAKLSHSYYFGMSGTIWLTADLFVILSAGAMANAAKTQSIAWLLASLVAALLGVLAYSTVIYSLLVLLAFCLVFLIVPRLRGRFPWPVLIGCLCILVAVLAVWLAYRPHPRTHPALDFDPIGLAAFVLTYLGGSISNGYWQPLFGLVILGAGVLAIRHLLAQQRNYDILLWVALFFFAPFNGLMTGIGRMGFGIIAAMSSRYQSVTVISLIAAIVLVLAALPKEPVSRRDFRIRFAGIAALLLMATFFVTNSKSIKHYAKRLEHKPMAEIALRLDLAGDQHLKAATKAMGQMRRVLPVLRAAHHVPYNTTSRCEDVIGQHLPAVSAAPAGAIENVATYRVPQGTRTAIELSGWAVQAGEPLECIAVVDGNGIVIGAGVAATMRNDPATQRSLRIGWTAVAGEPGRWPVCAFALFPGSSAWLPLADCQDERSAPLETR